MSPLPRSAAALRALHQLSEQGLPAVFGAAHAAAAAALDADAAPHLERALRSQLGGLLAALRAQPQNADLQAAGGRFLAQLASIKGAPELESMLNEFEAAAVVEQAIRGHPAAVGVQNNAQWALLRMSGPGALVAILKDPEVNGHLPVVSAAMWCLASGMRERCLPRAQRLEVARLAQQVVQAAGQTATGKLVENALNVVGLVLEAAASADHAEATSALNWVFGLMQQQTTAGLRKAGVLCIARLVEGNCGAQELLRGYPVESVGLFSDVMLQGNAQACALAARGICAVFGAKGILEALSASALQGEVQQKALWSTLGAYAVDSEVEDLVRFDVIGAASSAMQRHPSAASDALGAMGVTCEALIEHAARSAVKGGGAGPKPLEVVAKRGVDIIVQRLAAEVASPKPDLQVYAQALEALRNISRRSAVLAVEVANCSSLIAALETAFERDFFALSFSGLQRLLGAVLFFSGLPRLREMLAKYSGAPILHEAACLVLVDAAEQEDESCTPGTILSCAPSLACWATGLLRGLARQCSSREGLCVATVRLLGHVLGAVPACTVPPPVSAPSDQGAQNDIRGDPQGENGGVLESGLAALLETLGWFPHSAEVTAEVCQALVRASSANMAAVVHGLSALKGGELLLDVARRFPQDETGVLSSALVLLGQLGGVATIFDVVIDSSGGIPVQRAVCAALVQLHRLAGRAGLSMSPNQRAKAERAVQAARASMADEEQWELRAQADLALGLLMPPPAHAGPPCPAPRGDQLLLAQALLG